MDACLLETRVHERTNEIRELRGLLTLAWDTQLADVARYHSQRMATVGTIFHEAPDGETLSDRLCKMGYDAFAKSKGPSFCHSCGGDLRVYLEPRYCVHCGVSTIRDGQPVGISGENVAYVGYTVPEEAPPDEERIASTIVEGWLDSPGHRENLLNNRFEREAIGVTIRETDEIAVFVTQNFS